MVEDLEIESGKESHGTNQEVEMQMQTNSA